MNKAKLIQILSEKSGISKKEARVLYDAVVEELGATLISGKSVSIPDFGTFSVQELKKRRGFNPLIEKWMMLPPRRKPKFSPGEPLKRKVNN